MDSIDVTSNNPVLAGVSCMHVASCCLAGLGIPTMDRRPHLVNKRMNKRRDKKSQFFM